MGIRSKKIEPDEASDEQIGARLDELRDEKERFELEHRWTREDGHDGVDDWIANARRYLAASTNPAPFAGKSVDLSKQRIAEFVAAFVLGSGEFARWAHERVDSAPTPGGSEFSPLARAERDAERLRLDDEIRQLSDELQRRDIERRRDAIEAELSALGSEAA